MPLRMTSTQPEIHLRLLLLDINFTQMCPQWARVHERMNAHGHTYTVAKPQFEPLARDFIIALTLLPLPLRWWLIREWNVTYPVICMLIIACVHGLRLYIMSISFSPKHTHTCMLGRKEKKKLFPGDLIKSGGSYNVTGSQFYTLWSNISEVILWPVCVCVEMTLLTITVNVIHRTNLLLTLHNLS